jgi:hypothetical protein
MAAKGWGKSKVTRESLLPYIAAGIIPEFKQERWRVPAVNELEPHPRPGEFVIFLSFLDRGFALPPRKETSLIRKQVFILAQGGTLGPPPLFARLAGPHAPSRLLDGTEEEGGSPALGSKLTASRGHP